MLRRVCTMLSGLLLFVPAVARADGSLSFTPTHQTIVAGDPFSSMLKGIDWVNPQPRTQIGGVFYAQPNAVEGIQIESWSSSTSLFFRFTLGDASRTRYSPKLANGNPDCSAVPAPCSTTLEVGDKIIIQIDPNNAKGAALDADDVRFEISIKDNQVVAAETGKRTSNTVTGLWRLALTSLPLVTNTATVGSSASQYVVDVELKFTDIRPAGPALTTDFGIAIAVMNDLGNGHFDAALGGNVWDLGCSPFPSSMGCDATSDPLVDAVPSAGTWIQPARWGTGYFTTVPGTVTLSHAPDFYWSNSIHLGVCSAPTFDSIMDSPVDNFSSPAQLTLQNWYQYYPDNPCKMKVWIKAFNSGTTTVQKRLFVVWGRPNIGGTQDWFVVGLSAAVGITPGAGGFTSFVLWEDPPPQSFTSHPCLKVYALPDVLSAPWDATAIQAITTASQLNAMEAFYQGLGSNVQGQGAQVAQMNFSAVRTGICATPSCNSLTAAFPPTPAWVAAEVHGPMDVEPSAFSGFDGAQPPPDRSREYSRPVVVDIGKNPYFIVKATGIAVSRAAGTKPGHDYLSAVGGVAWAIPIALLNQAGQLTYKIDLGNPAVLSPADAKSKLPAIASPVRTMMVVMAARPIEKKSWWEIFKKPTPVPQFKVDVPERPIEAGQSVPITISIQPRRPNY